MRLLCGFTLLAAGLLLSLGDGFLAVWNAAAGAEHDIRARGPWLLAAFIPHFLIGTLLTTAGLALALRRRWGAAWYVSVSCAALGTVAASALLYADPSAMLWRGLAPARALLGPLGAMVLDLGILGGGAWLLRSARRSPDISPPVT